MPVENFSEWRFRAAMRVSKPLNEQHARMNTDV
jgi:hypothetical protein